MASEEQEEKTSLPPEELEKESDVKSLSGESAAKTEVEVPDCSVHSVVVYPDRAEVCVLSSETGASCIYTYSACKFIE